MLEHYLQKSKQISVHVCVCACVCLCMIDTKSPFYDTKKHKIV